MSDHHIRLDEAQGAFVDRQLSAGRHHDAAEVVGEALRRYEVALADEAERMERVRAVILEGREAIARGDFAMIETQADEAALFARISPGHAPGGGGPPS